MLRRIGLVLAEVGGWPAAVMVDRRAKAGAKSPALA